METIKNQKFERVNNSEYGIGYWEPIVVCNEKKERTSFSIVLEKMYIGGAIGYYLSMRFGGKEYSAEIAKIRVAGETTIDEVKSFFCKVVKLYQEERGIRKPSDYSKMFRNK